MEIGSKEHRKKYQWWFLFGDSDDRFGEIGMVPYRAHDGWTEAVLARWSKYRTVEQNDVANRRVMWGTELRLSHALMFGVSRFAHGIHWQNGHSEEWTIAVGPLSLAVSRVSDPPLEDMTRRAIARESHA